MAKNQYSSVRTNNIIQCCSIEITPGIITQAYPFSRNNSSTSLFHSQQAIKQLRLHAIPAELIWYTFAARQHAMLGWARDYPRTIGDAISYM